MNTKNLIRWILGSAFLIVLLSSCLNLNNKPIEVERYHMGSVMVNDKHYEHVVYFSPFGRPGNPFLKSSSNNNMIYFPILLSPAGGNQNTSVEYAILLCIDATNGIPELNKPYPIAYNSLLESASNSDEIMRLFIRERSKFLVDGAKGIAVVYDYVKRERRSASGTVTFTSFDLETKNCTGTYTLKTENLKTTALVFSKGTIATKIVRESLIL